MKKILGEMGLIHASVVFFPGWQNQATRKPSYDLEQRKALPSQKIGGSVKNKVTRKHQAVTCNPHHIMPHHARADSRFAPSQWETSLQSNAVSHWLGTNLESALHALSSVNPDPGKISWWASLISHLTTGSFYWKWNSIFKCCLL